MNTPALRLPEELLEIAFEQARVVLMNEAHHGELRCVRTREVGRRLLPTAHALGVRHLAMEALWNREMVERANVDRQLPFGEGYPSQSEMRALIECALDLGWTLLAYEADMSAAPGVDLASPEVYEWRELEQARNLLEVLPVNAPVLVWCGWGHLSKHSPTGTRTMAQHLTELSALEPFALDQTTTITGIGPGAEPWLDLFRAELEELGGTAGFLTGDAPPGWQHRWADAFLLSVDNELV
jgi:hypothetical protein